MTEQDVTQQEEQPLSEQPIIPPSVLLTIAGVSALAALVVLLINAQLGVVGWAALAIGLLSLVLLVVLAPQQTVNFLTGRGARFGGTSIIVTVIFLAVLITIYWFVAAQNWTYDFSQTDEFSLNEQNQEALQLLGADPEIPPIEILAFFDANSISNQERTEVLLKEYEASSGGKITYQFINPDRNPPLTQQYGASNGALVVINTTNEDPEAAEIVNTNFGFEQTNLTNAILSVSAGGEFRAYFLEVEEGFAATSTAPDGASDMTDVLTDRLNWTVEQVSFVELASEESEIDLNASSVDGDVLAILGGSQQLSELELQFLIDYLEEGGNLVIFAAPDLEQPALASSPGLNDYLSENFGLSFDTDVVILDPQQALQVANNIITDDFTPGNFITDNLPPQSALLAPFSRSINVAPAPEGAQNFDLVRSSGTSYAKTIQELIDQDVERNDDDPAGPLTIVAAAEDTETGARVVLFGSSSVPLNQFSVVQDAVNLQISFNALLWATGYDEFFQGIPTVQPPDFNPADVPVTAEIRQLNTINMISLFVLPFGMLAIGGVVWAFRREG